MLVTIEGKKGEERLVTTSLKVAEVFEKQHKDVLEKIRILAAEISATKLEDGYNPQFKEKTYKDERGKTYPLYEMNRDGFTELVGNMNGTKVREWKRKYFAAFNAMENMLKKICEERKQWEIERAKGIVVRHILTDTIKNVIPESLHKKFMYPNYTNLIYKVLFGKNAEGLRQDFKIAKGESVRDYFTADELSEVENLERLTAGLINLGWGYEQIKKFLSENVQRKSVDAIFIPIESKVSA